MPLRCIVICQLKLKANWKDISKDVEENVLAKVTASIQCLYKEMALYSELFNNLTQSSFPLGNYILNSLQEIENQIFVEREGINALRKRKVLIQYELKIVLEENTQLYSELISFQKQTHKELNELQKKLELSRREALAANQRLKSFKKIRRRLPLKNFINNNLSSIY